MYIYRIIERVYILIKGSGEGKCDCTSLAQYCTARQCSPFRRRFMECSRISPSLSLLIMYAHGRRLCSNWFRHGSTTISYPKCSLTFMRERYLHRCREQSFAIRACAMSSICIDVVSVHKLFAYRVVSTVSTDIVSSRNTAES